MAKEIIKNLKNNTGDIIIFALVFMSIFLIMAAGLLGVVNLNRQLTLRQESRVRALEIAEAGINYYHWHLAHNPSDYSDGTGGTNCNPDPPFTCGPYTRDYENDAGQKIGSYELEITPPPPGSTIITIRATGWLDKYPEIKRTISTLFGIPSLAEYLFLQDSQMNFSPTSETWGKVHSNRRIRFDGTNHSTVESAQQANGVWGAGGPQDLWHWPVPEIDFNKVTQDLSLIKTEALNHGIHLTHSGDDGYHLILRADNSADIYRVNTLWWPTSYYNIRNETFIENRSLENIHVIFIEDDVWVEGTVTNILVIASARFPDHPQTNTDIFIPNNITYEAMDENHILGLIAQKNIILTQGVPDTTTIDAHLLAQKGSIYRLCYLFDLKDSLTIYGSLIAKESGGFKCGTPPWAGFVDTYYYANPRAVYSPPPMFPITASSTIISWEEIE